ncbi:uncharacterized protein LOC111870983 isoform X2 [Cryptotermes secundus]|nr:uncharacterized protein LOC111870983 isoform X2 [Cryptotermes secundus]
MPKTAPNPKSEAKIDALSAEETPKPKSILKPPVESIPTPLPNLKPAATVQSNENETPKPKPASRPVATIEDDAEERSSEYAVATVEVAEKEPQLKPVTGAEVFDNEGTSKQILKPLISVKKDGNVTSLSRKSSYMAPKAATRREVELLYDLDNEKLAELKEAFHLFDLNHDGFIDKDDLKNTYISLGKTHICDEDIQNMLSEAINPLDFDAFVILLGYKSIELDPEEVLLEALSQWDYDNCGLISEERIKHDLMMWGDKFSSDEVEMALEDAPVFYQQNTGASMIDYVKFCKILCGLRKKPKMPQPGYYELPK